MTEKIDITGLSLGERVNINNPRNIPIKIIVSGFGCGSAVEFGLAAGQFFTIVRGTSALNITMQDISATELQHPGPILGSVVPNDMH